MTDNPEILHWTGMVSEVADDGFYATIWSKEKIDAGKQRFADVKLPMPHIEVLSVRKGTMFDCVSAFPLSEEEPQVQEIVFRVPRLLTSKFYPKGH